MLSERQGAVLRAMITAYVGGGEPISSGTLSHLLPMSISPASIRTILAELAKLGFVEKPHASAGRIPTERGLRVYVDQLVDAADLGAYEKRALAFGVREAEGDELVSVASQLLSERTRLLGFAVAPRLELVVLRHVSLVRLSTERLLVVLVSREGAAHRRVIDDAWSLDQPDLDRIAAALNERVFGRTLREVRDALRREARGLRQRADRLLRCVVELGSRALGSASEDPAELVIATRLALLDQPEFRDTRRVRDLFEALETKERLLEVLDRMLEEGGVRVAFGEEVAEPGLRRCALVACHYGDSERASLGTLGVIGPSRMDYARVIPMVEYLSRLITERLSA